MDVKWTKSERKQPQLVVNEYIFRVKNRKNGTIYWRCTKDGCTVTAKSIGCDNVACDNYNKREIMQDLKQQARDNPTTSIQEIHEKELSSALKQAAVDNNIEVVEHVFPGFYSARSSMYLKRSQVHPKLPKAVDDIVITGDWCNATSGDLFMLHHDRENDMIVFATVTMLERLCKSKRVYCDGTFKSSPNLFKQLYTIHYTYGTKVFPGVFAVLTKQDKLCYDVLFKTVITKSLEHNLIFSPKEIVIDFEKATISSIRDVFDGSVQIRGCYFHYAQAILRNINSIGLKCDYCENHNFQKFVRRIIAFGLARRGDIDDLWLELQDDVPTEVTKIGKFMDYYVKTWLDEHHALYKRNVWNHGDNDSARTNNQVEGWHSRFSKRLKKVHPNIYALINALKIEQEHIETQIRMIQLGKRMQPQKKIYRDLEHRLKTQRALLDNHDITPMQFIDSIKYDISISLD